MCRIEEEQSFEELKILRELVHDRFYKQEELAEVRNLHRKGHLFPAHPEPFGVDVLVLLSGHMATHGTSQHLSMALHACLFVITQSLREPQFDSPGASPGDPDGSGGSGMLQYLQSWFPGWGGWYGQQSPEGKVAEGLTAESHEHWMPEDILGRLGSHLQPSFQPEWRVRS